MKKKKKNQSIKDTIANTIYIFSLIKNTNGGKKFIILNMLNSFINSLFPLIIVIFPGMIINELISTKNINKIIIYVTILVTTPLINQIYNFLINRTLYHLNLMINLNLEINFYKFFAKMDYETIEKPDIQVKKDRAQKTLSDSLNIINQVNILFMALLSLIAISTIVASLNALIIILIVLIIFINSFYKKNSNKKKHNLSLQLSKFDRYQGAYVYMLEDFSYSKETRLFNSSDFLTNIYYKSKQESNTLEEKFSKEQSKPILFNSFTNFIQQSLIYSFLIYLVLNGNIAIGTMTIYLTATSQFYGYLSNLFNSYLTLTNYSLSISELKEYLNIPCKQYEIGNKTPKYSNESIIEFKNVSFKYPGSEIYSLKNINIKFKANEKLCIVGPNGAGKSTFIKLLTRLYFPTEGEILLDGVNINEFNYTKYQALFSPVFQDFASYNMTILKNVTLDDNVNLKKVEDAFIKSGLSTMIEKLPKKYDTQVGKWIDEEGVNPSGGEEQRMAIARALYHERSIYILDEPTASLDPDAEYEIYLQFNNMIKNKAAVIITHRLSAVQLADKVAVFNKGSIIEYGTHNSLYKNNGKYTEMFDKQAKFYNEK